MVKIKVTEEMKQEASQYSTLSRNYTSRRHDFHKGGPDHASIKMNEGKIGEKAFRTWLDQEGIPYVEDSTSFDEADNYDFIINGYKVDVKTRTEDFHIRTLELVEQVQNRPKDIYVSVRYYRNTDEVELIGVISAKKLVRLNQIENQGYKDNYVAYDHQLGSIDDFKKFIMSHKNLGE